MTKKYLYTIFASLLAVSVIKAQMGGSIGSKKTSSGSHKKKNSGNSSKHSTSSMSSSSLKNHTGSSHGGASHTGSPSAGGSSGKSALYSYPGVEKPAKYSYPGVYSKKIREIRKTKDSGSTYSY